MATERRLRERIAVVYLRSGVPGVPGDLRLEVGVSVVLADGVDLFFVTLDAVGGTNVVSEDPSLTGGLSAS